MTISHPTLAALKEAKNSVIGNPTAKRALAQDEAFIGMLVDYIHDQNPPEDPPRGSQDEIRIEAAHILASLSYGPSDALSTLLKLDAPQAFLIALSNTPASGPPALKAALARGFRVITGALSDLVGPSEWGLQLKMPEPQSDAKDTLDTLFELDALDIYLPLLTDSSTQVCISIAQLLASSLRLRPYRLTVSEWLPPSERHKEIKGKRGWEKAETARSPSRSGAWVARQLSSLLLRRDVKVQEAALSALAALARDNTPVAVKLGKPSPDQTPVLASILNMCKARSVDQQIAACLCATSIIRAGIRPQYPHKDQSPAMTVIHVANNLISSGTEKSQVRTKACQILYRLVCDDKDLCQLAYERSSLTKLSDLLKSITPTDAPVGWDEDEPESVARLREAALTTIASISLFDNEIRSAVTDSLLLIPYILISLSHHHPGVRYAACQCVRALSRAVAVLRTNIVDSGLGLAVYRVFCKEDEDPRVRHAASSVICNLVTDFSPLQPVLLERGIIQQSVVLLSSSEPSLALNALWTLKNLLYKSTMELKQRVTTEIGWETLQKLLTHENPEYQEQAFHLIRNITDCEAGIEMVFGSLGSDALLSALSQALESEHDDVLRQAAYVLGNLVNTIKYHSDILAHPRILISLRQCLIDAKVDVRRPAISCVRELIRVNPRSHHELHEVGIDVTVRHMCDYGGGLMASSPTTSALSMGVEENSEVREIARDALRWLERSGEMGP